ncbi:Shikimate dehydrogenase (NADP(+)) [Carnimonas sp. R-84981]|uniref:shikimate dehydrogenase n=1 Tax=Carnimonas bestiolae TaxID=3402172 RepID=UPI003EDC6783
MSLLYCVFGHPIHHSRSPDIHLAFARQFGLDLRYEKREAPLDGFAESVAAFIAEGGSGANVTVPFKQQALTLAGQVSDRARRAGAINTLKRTDAGDLYGDNTDGEGLVSDLKRLGIEPAGANIAILGAGGAVRGVLAPLLAQQPKRLVIANRTVARGEQLAQEFSDLGAIEAVAPDALSDAFDLVINGTSASLSDELPALGNVSLAANGWGYDMVYAAAPTAFMRWASEQGGNSADGLGMLVGQAAESFYVWLGKRPDPEPVLLQLRKQLSA